MAHSSAKFEHGESKLQDKVLVAPIVYWIPAHPKL
jgi:hypothetical protein